MDGHKNPYKSKLSEVLSQHPEVSVRKEKIFSVCNLDERKTKIICTLG